MTDTRFIAEYPVLVRHRNELRAAARARRRRLGVAVPVIALLVIGGLTLSLELGVLLAAIGSGVVFFLSIPAGSTVSPGDLSGVEGEVAVLKRLQQLPDDFTVFNRLRIPDPWLPNGQREVDFLVIGPPGVFVVEVKNTPGLVYVSPGENSWPVTRRAGCGSRPTWNRMDNPVNQASAQADALGRWLLQRGVAVNPRPVVCLAHPEAAVENAGASTVPVLTADQLTDYFGRQNCGPAPPSVIDMLRKLRHPAHSVREHAAA